MEIVTLPVHVDFFPFCSLLPSRSVTDKKL